MKILSTHQQKTMIDEILNSKKTATREIAILIQKMILNEKNPISQTLIKKTKSRNEKHRKKSCNF